MKSVKYYVASCLECNDTALIEVNFKKFNKECCTDCANIKLIKMFNDEKEAENYFKLLKKDEE